MIFSFVRTIECVYVRNHLLLIVERTLCWLNGGLHSLSALLFVAFFLSLNQFIFSCSNEVFLFILWIKKQIKDCRHLVKATVEFVVMVGV